MPGEIKPQPGILDIAPYQGGASKVDGVSDVVKLSSNENPFGPSDAAKEAFAKTAHALHRYPPTDHAELRQAIADVHGLDPARIICGVGSDEVLNLLSQAYAGPGDEAIYTEHGFSLYPILIKASGATPVVVAEQERRVDVEAILTACTAKTKIVYLTNPGNPTGTMIGANAVAKLAAELPPHVLLILDGAYTEYTEGYDGGAALVEMRENVVMTRTFSKIYGLGGLRIGWGYGPAHVIDVLNRIRQPFNLSETQLKTAIAAVRDQAYVRQCQVENTRMRAWLAEALAEMGILSDTSCTNFILARFQSAEEAAACNAFLTSYGILVRATTGYGLASALRITVGDEASCRRVVHAIGLFKEAQP